MPVASPALARRLLVPALATAAALALAGCVAEAPLDPAPAPTTPSGSPIPEPEPTEDPAEEPQPITASCAELVDPDVVYAFDPNFALLGEVAPDAGTPGALAVARGGVACRWVRESGDARIDLAVARLDAAELDRLKNEAFAAAPMVPTYGDEAYFDAATGTATVFSGDVWLVISSSAFAEPGEPTGMIESALAATRP